MVIAQLTHPHSFSFSSVMSKVFCMHLCYGKEREERKLIKSRKGQTRIKESESEKDRLKKKTR